MTVHITLHLQLATQPESLYLQIQMKKGHLPDWDHPGSGILKEKKKKEKHLIIIHDSVPKNTRRRIAQTPSNPVSIPIVVVVVRII